MNRYGFIQRIKITPDMKDPVSGQRVFFEFLVTYLPNRKSVKGAVFIPEECEVKIPAYYLNTMVFIGNARASWTQKRWDVHGEFLIGR
jgi:hypothetical protein